MEENKNNEVAVIPQFDGIAFLSRIESADSLQKKVKIFNDALNQDPIMPKNMKAELEKKGLSAGNNTNYDYIPIGIIQESLRQMFFQQVSFSIKNSFRDLNSFIVIATIRYKCPISLEWKEVDGIGAKAIQQSKGATIDSFNSTMQYNGLEMAVGTAYSRAIKNGAKCIGTVFGGNLNRDDELDGVTVFSEKVVNKDEFNLKLLTKLLEEKESQIKSHDLKTIQDVIDNKQVKVYKRFIDYLEKL
jgi:hypothetical protein